MFGLDYIKFIGRKVNYKLYLYNFNYIFKISDKVFSLNNKR